MSRHKLVLVATNRADMGLLMPLWQRLQQEDRFAVSWLMTGVLAQQNWPDLAHHSINMPLQSDSENSLCQAMSTELSQVSTWLEKESPDLLIVLGDRYELLAVAVAALIHKIPIAHLHGGESTFGVVDEAIRHSVTKMASLHFASHEKYLQRIIQLGEQPQKVWLVGAIGLDNFANRPGWSQQQLSEKTGLDFSRPVILLTYHPVTLDDYQSAQAQALEVMAAIQSRSEAVLMTRPNPDTGGQQILKVFEQAAEQQPDRFKLVDTLGIEGYSAAMKYASAMLGNSSSGIIEAATFHLPVINIGDRQAGRIAPQNVLNVACNQEAIQLGLNLAMSEDFVELCQQTDNPYGQGNTAEQIVQALLSVDLDDKATLLKKSFYDIAMES